MCDLCESKTNDFVKINNTEEYSDIEIALNRQGMLRVRVQRDIGRDCLQDIVTLKHCPLCGKRIKEG